MLDRFTDPLPLFLPACLIDHPPPPPHTHTQEESIDRPDAQELAKYGAKLKPTISKFEEDVVRSSLSLLLLRLGVCLSV